MMGCSIRSIRIGCPRIRERAPPSFGLFRVASVGVAHAIIPSTTGRINIFRADPNLAGGLTAAGVAAPARVYTGRKFFFCEVFVSLFPPNPRNPFSWCGYFIKLNFRPEESTKCNVPCFGTSPVSPRGQPIPSKQAELPLEFIRIAESIFSAAIQKLVRRRMPTLWLLLLVCP